MPRRTLSRRLIVLLAVLAAVLTTLLAAPVAAGARTPVPTVPAGRPASIEPAQIQYVAQDSCGPGFRPGTKKLIALLHQTYPAVSAQGSYACGTDGTVSEHYEGRAIDWMASVKNKTQHADALALISWLLATDTHGNRFAMARRLGVMYIIYDNRMWGGWDDTWEPYDSCAKTPQAADDNACHRTHVHLSLTWNGAMGRTTFWTSTVTATDYGRCRSAGLNWAGKYTAYNPNPCAPQPTVKAPAGASTTLKALERYSGAWVGYHSTGPVVVDVQKALHVRATGSYLGSTSAAVKTFQRRHRLVVTGAMNLTTWRALIAGLTPKT